jgi:hypothetical protein
MKKKFRIISFFTILALSIFENKIKPQIISHENKFYISLSYEQNQKLKEILSEESLNNLKLNNISENTYLINDTNLNISSFYEIKEKKKFQDFENSIKSCNK